MQHIYDTHVHSVNKIKQLLQPNMGTQADEKERCLYYYWELHKYYAC